MLCGRFLLPALRDKVSRGTGRLPQVPLPTSPVSVTRSPKHRNGGLLCLLRMFLSLLRSYARFCQTHAKEKRCNLKKDYNVLYTLFNSDGHILSALCFDFRYLLCRCAHNPYACIAHTVKEHVKLPPLRVLLWRRFQKELVYGYIVAEH